jgi:pimeloyl-ACP methyl ester carboxylesterase
VHPFRIEVPDAQLADLRRRIAATRWPANLSESGWERGVPTSYLRELAEYWRTEYDWRAVERRLNAYPQYVTEIDGTTVHFLHIVSKEPDACPVLLTHGWPGSVVEFLDVIGPLTDPRAYGGDPAKAFHLVVPSLPGYGFSGPVPERGWDVPRIARAWGELMHRLGYDSYVAAGGDWGSIVSLELARQDPAHVMGAHLSTVLTAPSGEAGELARLSESDSARLADLAHFHAEMSGYLVLQSSRPQTVSYGLTDSPVGQLAWIVEKFREWNRSVRTPDELVSRDLLLSNVTIYWLTRTAGTSAQLYFESAAYLSRFFTPGVPPEPVHVPIGVASFRQDSTPPIRAFAERDYPSITRWSELDGVGHFATMERPELFVADIQDFVGSLRA